MDEMFDKKHEMMQMLLSMLKKNAADEVGMHLAPKAEADLAPSKDEHGLAIEKVSVEPADEHMDASPEGESLADAVMAHKDAEEHGDEHEEAPEELGSDPEEPAEMSAFSHLMGKKKGKK